jgi:DNA-binding response OmpR family regulator
MQGTASRLSVHGVVLDRSTRQVTIAGTPVSLTVTEFELLATLMDNPGRVFSRENLLERLHGFGVDGVARTIDVHVRNLRAKIEPDPPNPTYVTTVYGVGYRFGID